MGHISCVLGGCLFWESIMTVCEFDKLNCACYGG